MIRIILGSIMLILALFNLLAIGGGYGPNTLGGLIEAVLYFAVPIWMIREGMRFRKHPKLVKKENFFRFISGWLKNIEKKTMEVYMEKRPPYLFFAMWLLGIAHLMNMYRYMVISISYMNNWWIIWPVVLLSGIYWGWFLYYVAGFITWCLIRISGGKADFRQSANIFVYSNLYLYIALVGCMLINTLLYGNDYLYGNFNAYLDVVLKFLTFSVSMGSVMIFSAIAGRLTQVKRRGILFLLILPLILVFLITWFRAQAPYLSEENAKFDKAMQTFSQGDKSGAEAILSEVINDVSKKNNKDDLAKAYVNRGVLYEAQGDTEKAIKNYEEALTKIDENSSHFQTIKGLIAFNQNKMTDAAQFFENALKIDANDFNANNRLGLIYMGRYGEEFKDLKRALPYNQKTFSSNPQDASATQNLAFNYFELEDYEKALPLFKSLVESMPDTKLNRYMLGVTYYRLGDIENAQPLIQKAIELDPTLNTDLAKDILK